MTEPRLMPRDPALPGLADALDEASMVSALDAVLRSAGRDPAVGCRAIGVMLHHAGLDDPERRSLRELIRLLSVHPRARLAAMATAHWRAAPVGSGP